MEEICGQCRYWLPPKNPEATKEGEPIIGQCRRYPPAVTLDLVQSRYADLYMTEAFSKYPEVQAGHWCGEYQGPVCIKKTRSYGLEKS